MHWAALFFQIGGYHAARLKAVAEGAPDRDFKLTALQIVAESEEHPWGDATQARSFEVLTLFKNEGDRRQANRLGKWKACWKALETFNPEGMAIAGWGLPEAQAALAWCKFRKKPVFVMSESKADDAPRLALKEWAKKNLWIRHFGSGLVGGRAHAAYLKSLGIPEERIFLGYDVVDNEHFQKSGAEARPAWEGENQGIVREQHLPARPYFLAVSRFVPRKNLVLLIEAYALYRSKASESAWPLVLCGSGPQEARLRALVHSRGLQQNIHMPGFASYTHMPRWYAGAGAFIHPALHEQWGLVVNEAMAAGLPVLVSRTCGCFPELVAEGQNGFGFDPTDTQGLAALLARVSSSSTDRKSMEEASLKKIREFTPQHFSAGFWKAANAASPMLARRPSS